MTLMGRLYGYEIVEELLYKEYIVYNENIIWKKIYICYLFIIFANIMWGVNYWGTFCEKRENI